MDLTNLVVLPRALPAQPLRPTQDNVPGTRLERDRLKAVIQAYVSEVRPVPPMPMDELREHADRIVDGAGLLPKYRDYVAGLVNNEACRVLVAGAAPAWSPPGRRQPVALHGSHPRRLDGLALLCQRSG